MTTFAHRLCLLIIVLLVTTTIRAADTPPNVLLILSDDQSVPHLGCYGNADIHTPNIDKLASEGMLLRSRVYDRAAVRAIAPIDPHRPAYARHRHVAILGRRSRAM